MRWIQPRRQTKRLFSRKHWDMIRRKHFAKPVDSELQFKGLSEARTVRGRQDHASCNEERTQRETTSNELRRSHYAMILGRWLCELLRQIGKVKESKIHQHITLYSTRSTYGRCRVVRRRPTLDRNTLFRPALYLLNCEEEISWLSSDHQKHGKNNCIKSVRRFRTPLQIYTHLQIWQNASKVFAALLWTAVEPLQLWIVCVSQATFRADHGKVGRAKILG